MKKKFLIHKKLMKVFQQDHFENEVENDKKQNNNTNEIIDNRLIKDLHEMEKMIDNHFNKKFL